MFLQPGLRGQRLAAGGCGPWRRAGAWLNHGAGPVHGAGAGPSAEQRPCGRVSGWQLEVRSPRRRRRWPEPSAHRLRAAPAVVLARTAPSRRRGRPGGALPGEHRGSVSGHLRKKVNEVPGAAGLPPAAGSHCRGFSSVCSAGRAGRVGSGRRGRSDWDTEDGAQTPARGLSPSPSCWLVGSIRSEGVQSCEEVRNFSRGAWWDLSGAVPDSPRAGKARTVGGLGAWARAGASGARTLHCLLSEWPFVGEVDLQVPSDRTRCLPEKGGVAIPSAAQLRELQGSACC